MSVWPRKRSSSDTDPGSRREVRTGCSKGHHTVWICGALLAAGAAGFALGVSQRETLQSLAVRQPVPLEFYLTEPSFSEVENTKAKLDALCTQFLTELRARTDPSVLAANAANFPKGSEAVDPAWTLEQIQAAIVEFKGTTQEMILVRELLHILKRSKLNDRWLDVYLGLLYAHPTEPLVSKLAKEAIQIGKASGRELELANAFLLLDHIPAKNSTDGIRVTAVGEATLTGPPTPIVALFSLRQSGAVAELPGP